MYSDTDKMGYMYYGRYAKYLEMGRVEALRSLGFSYLEMEESGFIMPVLELKTKYIKPLFYDDEVILHTKISSIANTRIYFEYEILNPKGEVATVAETTLVFVNGNTRKPCPAPEEFRRKISIFFDK